MPLHSEINIRPMEKREKKQVAALMRKSFPLIQQLFFSFTPKVWVAEKEGTLIGGIVLKSFTLTKKKKIGLLYWSFVHPEARREGIGRLLYDTGIHVLEQEGCTDILGCIEGHNTPSSNLLADRGFEILSPGAQFKRFGLHTFLLWIRIFHFLDIGHFLWARPALEQREHPALQWWGSFFLTITLITLTRFSSLGSLSAAFALFLGLLSLFSFRFLAMKGTAFIMGSKMRFRAWESGFPLFFVLSFFLPGILYPVPGGLYPEKTKWNYNRELSRLGPMALAGALSLLFLTGFSRALLSLFESGVLKPTMDFPLLSQWMTLASDTLATVSAYGKTFLLFDMLFIFFPFTCFNGRRIWDWNKTIWIITALSALCLVIF